MSNYNNELMSNNADLQAILDVINTMPTTSDLLADVLKYTAQTLTSSQQTQARENIDALANSHNTDSSAHTDLFAAKAPIYSPYKTVTASTTLTSDDYGKFIIVESASAATITLPTLPNTNNEMEIMNIGAGEVTISGLMQLSMTGVVLAQGDAVTLKSTGSVWCVIGSYEEV